MWWGSRCTWTARTLQTHELVHPSLSSLLWAALGLGLVLGPLQGRARLERTGGEGPGEALPRARQLPADPGNRVASLQLHLLSPEGTRTPTSGGTTL